jgi:large subunit ribosomal protein L25
VTYELKASVREEKNPRELRRRGLIPGVVYGPGVHKLVTFERRDLERLLSKITRSSRIELQVNGERLPTFIRDIHYNALNDQVIHIDLYNPPLDQPVKMEVPLRFVGEAKGTKAGGMIDKLRQYLRVVGLADQIPEIIELDISELDIGQTMHVRDLTLQNIRPLVSPDATLVTLLAPRKEEVLAAVVPVEGEAVEGPVPTAEGGEAAAAEAPAAGEAPEKPVKAEKLGKPEKAAKPGREEKK